MSIKIGINGFGRIGRLAARIASERSNLEITGINDITDAKTLAFLMKYDSVHGKFRGTVDYTEKSIIINGKEIPVSAEKDPLNLKWGETGTDVVIESTGLFTKRADAEKHVKAGAKKVIISAPGKDAVDATIVLGVNESSYDKAKHTVISNASCTTNCLAPLAKVLLDNFGIVNGFMTTVHSYTNDQKILDLPHKDLRRARAAAMSMIPTSTGAAKALGLVIPEIAGRLDGIAVRVPTPDVSLVDLTINAEKKPTVEEVNAAFKKASQSEGMAKYLEYCDEPLVSIDFTGNPHSSIFDAKSTFVKDSMIKVFAWYDNEFGYSNRIVDLVEYIMR